MIVNQINPDTLNAEIRIRRSRFICQLHKVTNIEEAKNYISTVSRQYRDATHNCWAYILGNKADIFHSSDAGEPSGTAGKPILSVLRKHDLTNIVSVVTRYYGGVKLGVRGLIEAYSQSVEEALSTGSIEQLIELVRAEINTGYDFGEILKYKIQELGAVIENIEYGSGIKMQVSIPAEKWKDLDIYLQEMEKSGKLGFSCDHSE